MASAKRINILIYAGPSTSLPSVRHATWTLRRLLGPNYAVHTLSSDQLLKDPWPSTCALLVMPGGADMGYCRILNGEGNRRIKTYVSSGGRYLGLCAGGYYGSAKCEFEVGRKGWEVIGERELAFYPGICRGLAFKGFVYGSEKGARAVKLNINPSILDGVSGEFNSYYNGGGAFVDAKGFQNKGVEVLASFEDDIAVDVGDGKAAVVYCKVGDGAAVLTGPHPEFAGANLDRDETSNPNYGQVIDALVATDQTRTDFLKACLTKLGLEVSRETVPVPSLSSLHLSSAQPSEIEELLHQWQEADVLVTGNDGWHIKGENDTFRLKDTESWSMASLKQAISEAIPASVNDAVTSALPSQQNCSTTEADEPADSSDLDYNATVKTLIPHTTTHPSPKETPHFNHAAFYASLSTFQHKYPTLPGNYGRTILYGEIVTSTQTLLEKNPTLLSTLPIGTTAIATTQVSGRGRGTNIWVSPPGSMMFSTKLKHPLALSTIAPVVFIQYLAALAIVQGIKSYSPGYERLPIKLKWPNDIYALDPTAKPTPSDPRDQYVKIGGILVNSSYSGGDYTLIVGIGLNLSNPRPTTSLLHLTQSLHLPPPQQERLLASILVQFELLYARFSASGWNVHLEKVYYEMWLHSGQEVVLEMEGGVQGRVLGITRDWGLLKVEEVSGQGRGTGRVWELQSDGNSFDFWRGLLRRKI